MGKKSDTTIENRVYLFESLASSYVASATEVLSSEDPAVRQRARRALAELAFVSCVMADTAHLPAEQVRAQVLGAPERVPEAPSKVAGGAARKRNK
ncbi:hypothetical protein [Myxococcus xanthus]|uniref:Uncharacterized protein n=1 Tax=Myxococcus xanthus TaxID=34 RepID=A0A7Y4IE85_MYXXA|nr:hypothetical protein [Myxococcus xanthus]NOJ77657.1 hypothetical protein [Myxococcus xanthus]NOJ90997.1 hypothetical protein [Myxococcus xanthus]